MKRPLLIMLVMLIGVCLPISCGQSQPKPTDVESLISFEISDSTMEKVFNKVFSLARKHSDENNIPIERLIKTREFVKYLIDNT